MEYNVLIGVLMFIILVLAFALCTFVNKYVEMNMEMIKTLGDVKTAFMSVKSAADGHDESWNKRFDSVCKMIDSKMELIQNLITK